jgi:hypothetical protein
MGWYKKGHHAGIEAAFNFMRKALYIHKVLAEKFSMVYRLEAHYGAQLFIH